MEDTMIIQMFLSIEKNLHRIQGKIADTIEFTTPVKFKLFCDTCL